MVRVKICGITNIEDALQAVAAGADALGFVFHPPSPRCVTVERAGAIIQELPPFIQTVGLFVNADLVLVNDTADRCGLDLIQLHGDEPPDYCDGVRRRVLKAFRVRDETSLEPVRGYQVAGFLLDAWSPEQYGGTGRTFNWEVAAEVQRYGPLVLAGGLTPENVRQAVELVQPFAVDVSSGVEAAPGKKDPEKVREFIAQAKGR
jgi:phosphoribosylanthranilate isomerase